MTSPHVSSSWVASLQSTVSELVTELFNLLSSGEAGLVLLHLEKNNLWTMCKDTWSVGCRQVPKQSKRLWVTTSGSSFKPCMFVWMLEPVHLVFVKDVVQWFSNLKCWHLRANLKICRTISFRNLAIWISTCGGLVNFPLRDPMPPKYTWHQAQHLGSCWEIAIWWIFLGMHEDTGALVYETVLENLVWSDPFVRLSNPIVDQLSAKLKERNCLYLSNSQSSQFLGIMWEA